MRTLSARILLGFAALTITFGVIAGNVVFNLQKVENEVQQVRDGYVPLVLISKDLARYQLELSTFLDKSFVETPIAMAWKHRDREIAIKNVHDTLASFEHLPDVRRGQFVETMNDLVDKIDRAIAETVPLYQKVKPVDDDPTLEKLRDAERNVKGSTDVLAKTLDDTVRRILNNLEADEHRVRIWTLTLGLLAVALGALLSVSVVIWLRPLRQLRDAARRVSAGDYGSRIAERGPAEIQQLAREFNSMGRAVEVRERELVRSERLAAVGTMAAMITHEVRNPLSSIGLNTELLEDELDNTSDEAKELCRAIHREVDRLTAITDEYLAFARLPKPKLAKEPVNKLVASLADFVREDLSVKQVELGVELGAGDPVAMIDAAQIRQCLLNLVRNAADAVVAKGGGRVFLRTKKQDGRVVIEVEDEGTGISPDVLPRMFDPFFSTKEGGSGLGLALTQQIVKDHGGDVAVTSSVGRGTTFTVSVPAA